MHLCCCSQRILHLVIKSECVSGAERRATVLGDRQLILLRPRTHVPARMVLMFDAAAGCKPGYLKVASSLDSTALRCFSVFDPLSSYVVFAALNCIFFIFSSATDSMFKSFSVLNFMNLPRHTRKMGCNRQVHTLISQCRSGTFLLFVLISFFDWLHRSPCQCHHKVDDFSCAQLLLHRHTINDQMEKIVNLKAIQGILLQNSAGCVNPLCRFFF